MAVARASGDSESKGYNNGWWRNCRQFGNRWRRICGKGAEEERGGKSDEGKDEQRGVIYKKEVTSKGKP